MDVGSEQTTVVLVDRCKSLMNIIRRALSFREKRPRPESTDTSQSSIELEPITKKRFPSNSDVASTSFTIVPNAPSVYEDPFVAVTADGLIHVKYYYSYNPRTEFHMENVHQPHVKRLCRILQVKKIIKVYYANGLECQDDQICKTWGMCRNDVWWASHLNRMEKGNVLTNVVVEDGSTIRAGFSVFNIEAFAESIQCVGLAKDVPFQHGLPSPPFNALQIPFIDEDVEGEIEKSNSYEGTSAGSSE